METIVTALAVFLAVGAVCLILWAALWSPAPAAGTRATTRNAAYTIGVILILLVALLVALKVANGGKVVEEVKGVFGGGDPYAEAFAGLQRGVNLYNQGQRFAVALQQTAASLPTPAGPIPNPPAGIPAPTPSPGPISFADPRVDVLQAGMSSLSQRVEAVAAAQLKTDATVQTINTTTGTVTGALRDIQSILTKAQQQGKL